MFKNISVKRVVMLVLVVGIAGFAVLQVIPFGSRTNPPVTFEVTWDSARTEELARAVCMDCHSNETVWPWYSRIAPVSWLVIHDVDEGRDHLNISTGDIDLEEMIEEIQKGGMPPAIYLPMHPEARLSDSEKAELIAGLEATFAGIGDSRGRGDDDDD